MTREELEAQVRNLGSPWDSMMEAFRASRDGATAQIGGFSWPGGQDVYEQIATVIENHYEELLLKMIEIARVRAMKLG